MLATLLLLAAALPQSPSAPRSPHIQNRAPARAFTGGVVTDAQGRPVVGAEVTFVSRVFPQSTEFGPVRRHKVETGAKGRFRVELADGERYSAWARWPGGATRCAEGVMSRGFVRLHQDARCKPRTVVIEGLDAWPDHAKFTMHAIVGSLHVDHVPLRLRDGRVKVPALPAENAELELRRGDGTILHLAKAKADHGKYYFALPPPVTYRVVVTRAGRPFAGAEVRHCLPGNWHALCPAVAHPANARHPAPVVARSGVDGVATVVVPEHPKRINLTVTAKGHRMEMIRVRYGSARVGDLQDSVTSDDGTVPVELTACRPQRAPIGREFDFPVAAGMAMLRVALGAMAPHLSDHTHQLDMIVPIEDGNLRFDSALPQGTIINLALFQVHEDFRKRLERDHGTTVKTWRSAYSRLLMDDKFDKTGLKGRIAVKVVAPGGMPVANAMVTTQNMIGDFNTHWTDHKGMVVLPKPAPFGETDQGLPPRVIQAYGSFGIGATIVEEGQKTATVELVEVPQQQIRLVDEQGKPMVGERISARLGKFVKQRPVSSKSYWLLTYVQATTDADGRATLPVLRSAREIAFDASCWIPDSEFAWDPSKLGDVLEVVAVRPRARK